MSGAPGILPTPPNYEPLRASTGPDAAVLLRGKVAREDCEGGKLPVTHFRGSPHSGRRPRTRIPRIVSARPRRLAAQKLVFLPATTLLRPPQATGGTSHPRRGSKCTAPMNPSRINPQNIECPRAMDHNPWWSWPSVHPEHSRKHPNLLGKRPIRKRCSQLAGFKRISGISGSGAPACQGEGIPTLRGRSGDVPETPARRTAGAAASSVPGVRPPRSRGGR